MLGAKDSFVLERRSTLATRKDGKGRALRKGEHYRKSDGDIPIHITMCLEIENSYTQIILQN